MVPWRFYGRRWAIGDKGGNRRVPVYRYKAAQLDGKILRGEMQAPSRAALQEQLLEKELYLTDCAEAEKSGPAKSLTPSSWRSTAVSLA